MQSETDKGLRRSSSLRRDSQQQNYSKPVRAAQFSPSPIRKGSGGSRVASATSSFRASSQNSGKHAVGLNQLSKVSLGATMPVN